MTAYYNEIDPYAAAHLENLIAAGHIAPGIVDTRDIRDVLPADLDGFTQCHFFAGVGIWSAALRVAGWSDDKPVWTGSCPCQPFSAAGAKTGFDDERHLWPHWHWLIAQCRPETILGEQVAGADGLAWADLVSDDLEACDYAIGQVITPAAGFRSFHIRQRQYFAANDLRASAGRWLEQGEWIDLAERFGGVVNGFGTGLEGHRRHGDNWRESGRFHTLKRRSVAAADTIGTLAHPSISGLGSGTGLSDEIAWSRGAEPADDCGAERVGNSECNISERRSGEAFGAETEGGCFEVSSYYRPVDASHPSRGLADAEILDGRLSERQVGEQVPEPLRRGETSLPWFIRDRHDLLPDAPDEYWRDADWLFCRDGIWRPVGPGAFPLAYAAPARMGRLRAYGNGLDLAQAAGFVRAYMERHMVDLSDEPAADLFDWSAHSAERRA